MIARIALTFATFGALLWTPIFAALFALLVWQIVVTFFILFGLGLVMVGFMAVAGLVDERRPFGDFMPPPRPPRPRCRAPKPSNR